MVISFVSILHQPKLIFCTKIVCSCLGVVHQHMLQQFSADFFPLPVHTIQKNLVEEFLSPTRAFSWKDT